MKELIEIQSTAEYSLTLSGRLAQKAVTTFCLRNQRREGCSAQLMASPLQQLSFLFQGLPPRTQPSLPPLEFAQTLCLLVGV